MLIVGVPMTSRTLLDPVGLGPMAPIPPNAAQVPMVTTRLALAERNLTAVSKVTSLSPSDHGMQA
jgi:hypothetical protein